jgi:arsenate reductase
MSEAFLNSLAGDKFEAESAGLTPTEVNPVVIEVMKEVSIDISQKETNSVFDFLKQGRKYNYVITVCDESSSEQCPLFPGKINRLHWSFDDPASFSGTEEEVKDKTRQVRDQIRKKISKFIKTESVPLW